MFSTIVVNIMTFTLSLLLWPIFVIVASINEMCRLIIGKVLLPKNYELIQKCGGNFVWSTMFNTRMVVVAMYSSTEAGTSRGISKDVERFQNRVFSSRNSKGQLVYGDLKKTQVEKLGYACLRDDSASFQLSQHFKLYSNSRPDNGEYFTEDEFTKVILPEYLSANMDESKPQWEWLLFPRIQRNSGDFNSLRVFRWDHRYMDGACAGVLLSECIFDPWEQDATPYIYNPKVAPPNGGFFLLAKVWAFVHLPFIVGMSLLSLLFDTPKLKPFSTWNNGGKKVFTNVHSLPVSQMIKGGKDKGKINFKSFLLTRLAPVLHAAWEKKHHLSKEIYITDTVNVATFQALTPYSPGLSNQFTILQANNVEMNGNVGRDGKLLHFAVDMTLLFAYMYTNWIGRLSIGCIKRLAAPADATVALNSIPFLRKQGSICGNEIYQIASWDCLYTPVGLDITVVGYGGNLFVSGFSVEECLSQDELNGIVQNYVKYLKD